MTVPDREIFENLYAGGAPWEIGRAQKTFVDAAEQIAGSILDAGCGPGDNALHFSARGHAVTGIDYLEGPIGRATEKGIARNLSARFLVKDALSLADWDEVFDSVIDSGLFHGFSDDDRRRYVEGLAHVLRPGGRLFLLCFSDEEPGEQGPRRISREELSRTFAEGWKIESIRPSRFEVRPDLKGFTFSEGGPKAWFVVAQRTP